MARSRSVDCAMSCRGSDWMSRRCFGLCAFVALAVLGGCFTRAVASHAGSTEDAQEQYAVGIDLGSSCIRVRVHSGSVVKLVSLHHNGSADPDLDHSSISTESSHSELADAIDTIDSISSDSGTRQLHQSRRSLITNSTCGSGMPSLVVFTDMGEQLVGWKAWDTVQTGNIQPHNIVTGSVKHLLGRSFNDTIVAKLQEHVAYRIVDHEGQAAVQVDINGTHQVHTPQSIVTSMLAEVHQQLQQHLNGSIKSTVIGLPGTAGHWIPMNWSLADKTRQTWVDAATAAGFNRTTIRLSQEAVLAGLALNAHKLPPLKEDKFLLVLDFGSTTLDTSLLVVYQYKVFEDLFTDSSFDVAYKALEMLEQSGCANGSSSDGVQDSVKDYLNKVSFNWSLALNVPIANVSQYIDYVLLVGGGASLTPVQQTIKHYFGPDKVINQTGLQAHGVQIEPEDAVAYGAALRAQEYAKADGGRLCCPGRYEPGDPNCDSFLTCCFDVAELSIGLETVGGLTHQMTPRNTITPNKKRAVFETVQFGQTSAIFKVYAGESLLSKHNVKLGELHFSNIASAHTEQFMVEVDMDSANITVTATTLSNNITKAFTVHRDYPLDNWTPQLNAHFVQDCEASIVKGWNDSALSEAPWSQLIMHYHGDHSRVDWEFDQLFCDRGAGSAAGKLRMGQTNISKVISASQESSDEQTQDPFEVSDNQGAAAAAMAATKHAREWLEAQEIGYLIAEDEAPVHQVVDTREESQQLSDLEHQVSLACRQLCPYVHLPLEIQQHMYSIEAPTAESQQPQQLDVSEGDVGPGPTVADGGKLLGRWSRAVQQPCTAVRPAAVERLEGLKTRARVCGAVAERLRSEAEQDSRNEHVLVT